MIEETVRQKAKGCSSNPDLRFIPKTDAKQAPKVKPVIKIAQKLLDFPSGNSFIANREISEAEALGFNYMSRKIGLVLQK